MNKNIIAATLALMAMIGFLITFGVLGFTRVPPENKDFFNMGFIALIGFVGTAFGYYLGTSHSSAQKNELLAQSGPALPANITAGPTGPMGPMGPTGPMGLDALKPYRGEQGFIRLHGLSALSLVLILILAGILAGCATVKKDPPLVTAGRALLVVKETIVTAATTTDRLCKMRQLPADVCTSASAAYEVAKPAYDSAVDAYLLMSQGGDPALFGATLTRVEGIAANMLQISGGVK